MMSMMQHKNFQAASVCNSASSSNTSPSNQQVVLRRSSRTKLRYRHDPYQMATNAIVSCDDQSSDCSPAPDYHGISPVCMPDLPASICQAPHDMSLESHENAYMNQAFPHHASQSSDEMYIISNAQQHISEEPGPSFHYQDMMSKLYDTSNRNPQAWAPAHKQKKSTKQRSHRKSRAATTAPVGRALLPQDVYTLVRFKYETTMYRCNFEVRSGDIVVVEADRGENTGAVEEVTDIAPTFSVPARVIRLADVNETKTLKKQRNQVIVTQVVRKTARLIDDLKINVIDTEMQADGKKLTVYYSAEGYVDFRQLQRTLYRRFQCRIWLVNVNSVSSIDDKQ